jgi:hypothetical protein
MADAREAALEMENFLNSITPKSPVERWRIRVVRTFIYDYEQWEAWKVWQAWEKSHREDGDSVVGDDLSTLTDAERVEYEKLMDMDS